MTTGQDVVDLIRSVAGQWYYSNDHGERMDPRASGKTDCSGTVRWAYLEAAGIDVGMWTGDESAAGWEVARGHYPSEIPWHKMQPGDLILMTATYWEQWDFAQYLCPVSYTHLALLAGPHDRRERARRGGRVRGQRPGAGPRDGEVGMDLTDMTLAYESPDGELLEFGPTSVYRFGDLDVLDSAWECELVNGRVSGARRAPTTSALTVYVDAPTEAAGVEARNRLEDVLDAGAAEGRLGRLRAGEWYTRCLCTAQGKDAWWFDGRYFEARLQLLRPDPVWTREQAQDFAIDRSGQAPALGKDYPCDYPYDYTARRTVKGLSLIHILSTGGASWRSSTACPVTPPRPCRRWACAPATSPTAEAGRGGSCSTRRRKRSPSPRARRRR